MEFRYFEDFREGDVLALGPRTVTREEIVAFAAEFDPQPFHPDAEAAKQMFFGELVASGWHTAAVTMRLLVEGGAPLVGGVIGAGAEITWPSPVRPGDVLEVESEILELRPSKSRPDRGIVTLRGETRNQRGEVVQVLTAKLVVPRRAS